MTLSGWTVLVWATVSWQLSWNWLVQDDLLFTCLTIWLSIGTMKITGPHVSPWLVHMEVVTGVSRAAREGKFWFISILQASDSVTFAIVSVAKASDIAQLQVSVEGDPEVWIQGENYDHFTNNPLLEPKKFANDRNLAVHGNKGNCLAHEIKNSKYG